MQGHIVEGYEGPPPDSQVFLPDYLAIALAYCLRFSI